MSHAGNRIIWRLPALGGALPDENTFIADLFAIERVKKATRKKPNISVEVKRPECLAGNQNVCMFSNRYYTETTSE